MTAAPSLDATRLCKQYGPFTAVDEVSFAIQPGEVVALLGPNGAGKTTTMRMLTGLTAPTSGTARVAGHDVSRDRLAAARCIGYLPERCPLYDDLTPHQSLQFIGGAHGLAGSRLADRIAEVAASCELDAILGAAIGSLSKGLRQRVGLAQALLHDPEVLILDEPSAGLDPVQLRRFRALVRRLGGRRTLIVSTHVIQEVEAVADRVIVINRGRVVFDGTVDAFAGTGDLEARFCALVGAPAGGDDA